MMSAPEAPLVGGIHHASLAVADVGEAVERWTHLLGLHGDRISDRQALLRCTYEDYSVVLTQQAGRGRLEYVCYELNAGITLSEARARIAASGVAIADEAVPQRGAALRLQDPDGNPIVLVERSRPEDARPAEVRHSKHIPAWHPRKFGHVNFLTGDVQRQVSWYTRTLGFAVTDWIGDEGVWLHVNADHHVLAFLNKGYNHIHHLAFELVDWGEMRVALDHLAQNRRHLVWGPGRHGMARNLFSYFRMHEEELFIELFCDLEQLTRDHQVRHFPDDPHSSNTWGILPPRTYFRFDQAAIDAEASQAYAYDREPSTPP
jgi:catechol 2,3-dioxygenase-like lactoylglutathione lyase family enzyme